MQQPSRVEQCGLGGPVLRTGGRPQLQQGVVGGKVGHAKDLAGDGGRQALHPPKGQPRQRCSQPQQGQRRKGVQQRRCHADADQDDEEDRAWQLPLAHQLVWYAPAQQGRCIVTICALHEAALSMEERSFAAAGVQQLAGLLCKALISV